MLDATYRGANNVENRHLTISNISEYFQAIGSSEAAVDSAVLFLIHSNLIEPFDPSERGLSLGQRLAINFAGQAHLRLATSNPVFFEQMALTTAISNSDVAAMLNAALTAKLPHEQTLATLRTLFAQHLVDQDEQEITIPVNISAYDTQRELIDEISGFMTVIDHKMETRTADSIDPETGIHVGVLGVIDFYDANQGFGFVDIEELGERCFVGADALKHSTLDAINDGDDILCDIGPSPKGPKVTVIHDIQTKPNEIALIECIVVRLVEAKFYGFVSVAGRSDDALFHFSLLQPEERARVAVGTRFKAEVRVNSKNGLQQVRRIETVFDV